MWLFCGTVIAHHPPNGSARCILSLLRGSSAWPGLLAPKKKREKKTKTKAGLQQGEQSLILGVLPRMDSLPGLQERECVAGGNCCFSVSALVCI